MGWQCLKHCGLQDLITNSTTDIINLDNYDITSFMKEKINSFLELDIIKNNLDAKFYKEYEFIEEKDNNIYHGIDFNRAILNLDMWETIEKHN